VTLKEEAMRSVLRVLVLFAVLGVSVAYADEAEDWISRGRYIVRTSGCNECHTEGYARSFGKVPESDWMTGRAWGEMGPWGTTFPTNVRLMFSGLTEQQWIDRVRNTVTRPPMPWYVLREMTDDDLRAIYRFISSLGPVGKPAPEYLPPPEETTNPHVRFPPSFPKPRRTGRLLSARVSETSDPLVLRGRYLAQTAWCNNCHTEGYFSEAGNIPEEDWLQGSAFGRNGAWGTTYATNLRLYMAELSEEQWIDKARHLKTRPTMPWFALNEMRDDDLRAIYRYIRLLGPAGIPAPSFLPSELEPTGAYAIFPRPAKK
jgi:mono/diheme cytochrome c family protein